MKSRLTILVFTILISGSLRAFAQSDISEALSKIEYLREKAEEDEADGYLLNAFTGYKKYYSLKDSIYRSYRDFEINEQLELSKINEMKARTMQMELDIKNRWLLSSLITLIALTLVFGVVMTYFFKTRNLIRQLKKSQQVKNEFLMTLSCELHPILDTITAYVEVLESPDADEEKIRTFTKMISEHSRTLLDIFNNVIDSILNDKKT